MVSTVTLPALGFWIFRKRQDWRLRQDIGLEMGWDLDTSIHTERLILGVAVHWVHRVSRELVEGSHVVMSLRMRTTCKSRIRRPASVGL